MRETGLMRVRATWDAVLLEDQNRHSLVQRATQQAAWVGSPLAHGLNVRGPELL